MLLREAEKDDGRLYAARCEADGRSRMAREAEGGTRLGGVVDVNIRRCRAGTTILPSLRSIHPLIAC